MLHNPIIWIFEKLRRIHQYSQRIWKVARILATYKLFILIFSPLFGFLYSDSELEAERYQKKSLQNKNAENTNSSTASNNDGNSTSNSDLDDDEDDEESSSEEEVRYSIIQYSITSTGSYLWLIDRDNYDPCHLNTI